MSKLNQFDTVAPLYDKLARTVFGDQMQLAQTKYLSSIRPDDRVLILGGGTGWILNAIARHSYPEIWYIEASSKMVQSASIAVSPSFSKKIHFVHGTEEDIPAEVTFDVVILNFFLDLFADGDLHHLLSLITTSLSTNGKVLATDFVATNKRWQKLLLWLMYQFFRWTCGIRNRKLPRWPEELTRFGFTEYRRATFFHGFIVGAEYHRNIQAATSNPAASDT